MKTTLLAATLAVGLTVAAAADARSLTIDLKMAGYSGRPAFLVAYVVDGNGRYVSTLYAAGSNGRYFEHFDRWFRMFSRARRGVDGTTGASMGSGDGTSVSVDVPDSVLNAGYTLRLESAVESQYYVPDEAEVPLDDAHNGSAISGKSYVSSMTVSF
ncbi:MAG: DUF2271 domain-containing protein [bacterium]